MLATLITNHVQQALARQMQQYAGLAQPYLMLLNGTAPFVATGTYSQFFSASPTTSIGFGYGSLVGIGQAFQVSSPLDVGQLTAYFKANGTVSNGFVTAYLYNEDPAQANPSPSPLAAPFSGPIMRAVEVYDAAEIAQDFYNNSGAGYQARTFTFDYPFTPGYYWVVLGSNYPASPGNSLLLGLSATSGLSFVNGYSAGDDLTGQMGPNGASGTSQVALTLAQKISAPPLQVGNVINVSGIGALIASQADQFQQLENAIYSLNEGRQLFNGTTYPAIGAQLDGLGAIVGQARNGQSDAVYLLFILGRIAANYSNGTMPDISTVVSLLFQTNTYSIFPLYPAALGIQIPSTSPLDPALFAQAIALVADSVSAGIGVEFGSVYPPVPFMYRDLFGPSVGGGYGDSTDPSVGGGYASAFYSNPGA